MNGLARPFFGWVSDPIARTMAIAFSLGGLIYLSLGYFGTDPWTFVLARLAAGDKGLDEPVRQAVGRLKEAKGTAGVEAAG
ncbi:MAG: hypothetical protein JOY64_19200 [Alphaproteobacteria bacterium]|nr:hypothetical protein [Alphaproteobacteria bacterium]MBV8409763.1 hypothetical protein [Alphaproteobacteria bacterium]